MNDADTHIYLSPHRDDVCFSVGHLAGRTGGELINGFSRSRHIDIPLELPADPDARISVITELRRQEDMRFASAARLSRHDLDMPEPPIVGLKPFDLTELFAEVGALSARLVPLLLELLPGRADPECASLYCPMGIGGHRNHLSMLLAIRRAYQKLAQRCTLFLYEDLYYASDASERRTGLAAAIKLFEGFELSPCVTVLDAADAERKMRWIGLYASQLAGPPQIARFTPASGLASGPHEIIWRVSAPRTRSRKGP